MTELTSKQEFMVLNGWCPFCDSEKITVETLEKYPSDFGKTWVHKRFYVKKQKLSCSNGHSFEILFKREKKMDGYSVSLHPEITVSAKDAKESSS